MSTTLPLLSEVPTASYSQFLDAVSVCGNTYINFTMAFSASLLAIGIFSAFLAKDCKISESVEEMSSSACILPMIGLALSGSAKIAEFAAANFGLLGAALPTIALGGWFIPKVLFRNNSRYLERSLTFSFFIAGIVSGLNVYYKK